MPKLLSAKEDEAADDPWKGQFARVPDWLFSAELTPAEFKTMGALLCILGGRRTFVHASYDGLASWCNLDRMTIAKAMRRFVEAGWLTMTGPQNWRSYLLNQDAIAADLYQPPHAAVKEEGVGVMPEQRASTKADRKAARWSRDDEYMQALGEEPPLTLADVDLTALTQEQLDQLQRGDVLQIAKRIGLTLPDRTTTRTVITAILEHQQSGS